MIKNKRFIAVMLFVIIAAGLWFVLSGRAPREVPAQEEQARSVEEPDLTIEGAGPAPEASKTLASPGGGRAYPRAATEEPANTATAPRGPGVIMVKLTSGDVEPRPGIALSLHHMDWKASEVPKDGTLFAAAEVGDDGEYEFTGLPLGRYAVFATGDGVSGDASTDLTKQDAERALNVALYEGGAISGVVRNSAGEGIEGATVSSMGVSEAQLRLSSIFNLRLSSIFNGASGLSSTRPMAMIDAVQNAASHTKSDVNGNYVLSNLKYGGGSVSLEYVIRAEAGGYLRKTMPAAAPGTDNWDIVLSQGGSVSGEVVDADSGEPMPGITVRVNVRSEAPTDDEGRFTIATLSPGEHTAQVIHEELAAVEGPAKFTVREGEETTGLRFELTLGGSVSGRLYDAGTGSGLAGETITTRIRGFSTEQETDSAGDYVLRGLPAGTYKISRGKIDGYPSGESKTVTVRLGEEVAGVDFSLSGKLAQISGMVTDWEGDPVAQATVVVRPGGYRTRTRSDGSFTVGGVTPGVESYVEAGKPEQGLADVRVGPLIVPKEGLSNVEIVMEMGGSIEGVVIDQNGKSVPGARVYARNTTEGRYTKPATADEHGAFKITGLAAGRYDLDPTKKNSYDFALTKANSNAPPAETVTLDAGQELTGLRLVLEVEEPGPFTIAGRVTNTRGEPVERVAMGASDGSFTRHKSTDKDGRYEIPGIPDGAYNVTATGSLNRHASETGIRAGSTGVDFVLQTLGSIEGRVLDARTREPITEYSVKNLRGGSYMAARPDDQGRFMLKVSEGAVMLEARAEGFVPGTVDLSSVKWGKTVRDVVLYLERGATIEGIVIDRNGDPIANAKIFLGEVPLDERDRERSVVANSTRYGAFTLDSSSLGPSIISAYLGSYGSGSTSVNLESNRVTQVEIVLSRGGEVEGVVTNAGKPVPGHEVTIEFPRAGGGGFEAQAKTDATGAYHFSGLPEGAATLTTHIYEGIDIRYLTSRNRSVQVLVQNGRIADADFDFPAVDARATIEGVAYFDENTPLEARIRVSIRTADGSETAIMSTDAGPDGSFLLDGLPGGTVLLSARFPGYASRVLTFDIQEGEHYHRDIDFGGDAAITVTLGNLPSGPGRFGVVVHHGVVDQFSLSSPEVVYRLIAGARVQGETTTLTGLQPGTYTIRPYFLPAGTEGIDSARHGVPTVVTIEEPGQQLNIDLTF